MTVDQVIKHYENRTMAAAKIGVTEQTIRNWENSNVIPRVYQLAIQTLTKNKLKAD